MKNIRKEVRQFVDLLIQGETEAAKWVGQTRSIDAIDRLPGDASTRRYYRVKSGGDSYILMKTEPFVEEGESYPFLAVRHHLAQAGVDVPEILDADSERGFILLEDLGDVTLLHKLREVSDEAVERELYERVIDSLIHAHVNASPERSKSRIQAFDLHFDYEKLMWEVNFTIEHFYQLHLGRKIPEEDLEVIRGDLGRICAALAAEPVVFTHRDFHSRNVMAMPGVDGVDRLVMIDFQDARLGPPQYDLASLLKDSYYQLTETQVYKLVDFYIAKFEALSETKIDRAHFVKMFDLMSIQRNFKAIGSFASFLNRRGNATYLKYIGNTFENIRRTLLKYPEYARLREVLFHYYYF